jgi:hypothetical protein
MDDGSLVRGETNITASRRRIVELMLDPPDAAPLPETWSHRARRPHHRGAGLALHLADHQSPGRRHSRGAGHARGVRVFICNLMTQANESLNLTASEHIERIYEHTRAPIFDYALVNTAPFSPETLARYAAEGASPIVPDIERIEALGVRASPATSPANEAGQIPCRPPRRRPVLRPVGHPAQQHIFKRDPLPGPQPPGAPRPSPPRWAICG